MALDPRIILGAQQFDLGAAMNAGRDMAMQQKAFDQQNALADLYKTQGAGIMAGDQNALAQLAQFDPGAALGIQSEQQQMAYREEDQQMQREAARKNAEAALAEQAATLDAAQVAQEAAAIEATLSGAAFFYQKQDQAGYDAFLQSKGIDPAEYPFQAFPAYAAEFGGVLDAMKAFAPPEPPAPLTTEAKLAADFKAGLIDQGTYEAGLARLAPKSTSLSVDPKSGVVTFNDGVTPPAGAAVPAGDALRTQITDADSMLTMIGNIANNPALSKVTGSWEGGGGNNVDDLNFAQRAYYGDDGLGVIQEIAQLQGNAWLGARALLKGGGQITDYESKKAESAMARLSRAQGDKEFKAALKDLEDALREGVRKLQEAQTPAAGATGGTAKEMSDEDFLKSLGIE